jgi:hypothetical protein
MKMKVSDGSGFGLESNEDEDNSIQKCEEVRTRTDKNEMHIIWNNS